MAVALNEKVIIKASRHHVKIVKDGPARGMTVVDELHVGKTNHISMSTGLIHKEISMSYGRLIIKSGKIPL